MADLFSAPPPPHFSQPFDMGSAGYGGPYANVGGMGGMGGTGPGVTGYPSAAPPAKSFWQRNMMWLVLLLVVGLAVLIGVLVWHARCKAKKTKGPYSKEIDEVSDGKRREDLLELQYLLQLSQRSNVTNALRAVISSNLNPNSSSTSNSKSAVSTGPDPNSSTTTNTKSAFDLDSKSQNKPNKKLPPVPAAARINSGGSPPSRLPPTSARNPSVGGFANASAGGSSGSGGLPPIPKSAMIQGGGGGGGGGSGLSPSQGPNPNSRVIINPDGSRTFY